MKKGCHYCGKIIETSEWFNVKTDRYFLMRRYCSEECKKAACYKRLWEKWDKIVKVKVKK